MTTENELLADLAANPDDVARFQVYADFLTDSGDPRGELVSAQLGMERGYEPALIDVEDRLLKEHRTAWLGPLAKYDEGDLGLEWRRGFLEKVRLGRRADEYEVPELDYRAMIEALFALPVARLLRQLTTAPECDQGSFVPSIEGIAGSEIPNTLEHLEFNRGGYWDISMTELGDLSPAYPRLRHLRSLKLVVGAHELGKISLPRLRSLEIVTPGLRVQNLQSIVNAKWPELERLVLYVGTEQYGSDVSLEDLTPIFAGRNLERVRHLALANSDFADDLPRALTRSKILPQLETLDLSHGTFGLEGVHSLLANRSAFAHLKHLDLSCSFIPEEFEDELRTICPEVSLKDNRGDEYRYVAIAE
jgi:uncharacterized protein (TIGR02996 family)